MKKFRFSLDAVLRFRASQEERAREAYSRANADLQQALGNCQALAREIENLFQHRRQSWSSGASSEQIQQMQQGLRALQEKLRQAQAESAQRQKVVDEKWKGFLAARQKRKSLEKLQEKQRAGHQLEAARLEQHMADEIALLKPAHGFSAKWR